MVNLRISCLQHNVEFTKNVKITSTTCINFKTPLQLNLELQSKLSQ